jgi:cytidine deaminase
MRWNEDSKALKEVWQMKDDAYKAVEGHPLAAALHTRLTTSIATAAQLGFGTTRALNCAEASVKYDGKW